jgi:hypothetical protein
MALNRKALGAVACAGRIERFAGPRLAEPRVDVRWLQLKRDVRNGLTFRRVELD